MKRDAQMIVGLALTDINFRQQLKTDFAAATKDYRLSDDEVTGLPAGILSCFGGAPRRRTPPVL